MSRGVTKVSTLDHPDLHVTYGQAQVEPRELYQVTGLGPQGSLGIWNGDIHTLRSALLERMYFCKVGQGFEPAPLVQRGYVDSVLREFHGLLVKRFSATPFTTDEVVDTYKGRKKSIYERAQENLRMYGLKRKHATSVAFVKVEKVKLSGAPRVIQPRKPEYNLMLGKYIKVVEHRLYRRIAKIFGDGPTVMKGYTVVDVARICRAKWDSFRQPVALGLDATKFDMHVGPAMLGWEHSIYNAIFQSEELRRLLEWQMNNRGLAFAPDGKLRYKVRGKRFSGDMNTALGNCIIMCGLVWTYAKLRGVDIKLVNNGDDCVVFMEREDLDKFTQGLDEWFLTMGFRMVAEPPAFEFEHLEFCQMHPIMGADGWIMVRNLSAALVKDCLVTTKFDGDGLQKWLYAVGECGLSLCSGIPVMQAFYEAMMRNGVKNDGISNSVQFSGSGLRMMRYTESCTIRSISPRSRLSVYNAWGVTPDEQIALEEHFNSWTLDLDCGVLDIETIHHEPLFDGLRLSW